MFNTKKYVTLSDESYIPFIMDISSAPQVSVIIPVYNTQDYIKKCLDSILAQNNKNYEVILVNDGSTDNSEQICREYSAADSRFKVFTKENGGVSSARNTGLDKASGKWVVFIDSDDWISEDFLTIPAEAADADIIRKPFLKIDNTGEILNKAEECTGYVITENEKICSSFIKGPGQAIWDKLILRSLIGSQRFDETMKIGEDFLFCVELFPKAKCYCFSPAGHYNYLVHPGSVMYKSKCDKIKNTQATLKLAARLDAISQKTLVAKNALARYVFIQLFRSRKFLNKKDLRQIRDIVRKIKLSELKYISLKWKLKFLFKRTMIYFYL